MDLSDPRYLKVIELAQKIGELLVRYQSGNLNVESKENDRFNPVTIADKEADAMAREAIGKLFPTNAILSEESSEIPSDYSSDVWMIDPLDGTKSYIKGDDSFGVHIGLCRNGRPVFGVVNVPRKHLLYFGEVGRGAFVLAQESRRQIFVSATKTLSEARLIIRKDSSEVRPSYEVIDSMSVGKRIPSSGIGVALGLISDGSADVYIATNRRLSKWDTCAPEAILREAGGEVTDLLGRPLDYKQSELRWKDSMFASNKILRAQLLEYSKKVLEKL
ncbi:MAG TPA: 3'(2'),5'-bisphosphate nucleotidase CysQ [Candidatus Paceibacterota bacterium]